MNDELKRAMEARAKQKKEKTDRLFRKFGIETSDETRERLQRQKDEAYEAVPIELKQKFLDLMWDGKNVGEAARLAGIDPMIGAEVIVRNAPSVMPTKVIK